MKSIVFLLIATLLFSSCYNYNIVAREKIRVGKKYKVHPKHSKDFKAWAYKINDESIVFKKNKTLTEISKTGIGTIEGRNFSYVGTGAILVVATLIVAVLVGFGDALNFGDEPINIAGQ